MPRMLPGNEELTLLAKHVAMIRHANFSPREITRSLDRGDSSPTICGNFSAPLPEPD